MRAPLVLSFLAAAILHAALLLGFQFGTLAQPLPEGDASTTLEVGLTEGPAGAPETPSPEPPAEPQAIPEPQPAPVATPAPESTPEPTPAPEPTALPSPEPSPVPQPSPVATPLPAPSPRPRPAAAPPHPKRSGANLHLAPGASEGTAPGTGSSGSAGGTSAQPRYRTNPKPAYPAEARRTKQEGTVLLGVEIGADGAVKSVTVKRTSGHPLLDDSALQTVRRWRFAPATAAGLPVASEADIPIRFNLLQ